MRLVEADDFVATSPPGAPPLHAAVFHGAGRHIACLQAAGLSDTLDLHVFDREQRTSVLALSGEAERAACPPMSLEEALSRERARQRYDGITNVRWVPGALATLSSLADRLLLVDVASGAVVRHVHGDTVTAFSISPKGDAVAFVSGHDLWLLPLDAAARAFGRARRLTDDGSATRYNGVADQVTREEVYNESGCCWSPDGTRLLLASFDVTGVEEIVVGNGAQTHVETARYSRPGGTVARFAVSLIDVAAGTRREVLAADAAWPYLRGFVVRGPREVVAMRLDRAQATLQLLNIDLDDGRVSTLLEQTQQPWHNAPDKPVFRKADGAFFLVHETGGTGRIGLYDASGRWQRDIGDDTGHVEGVLGPDAAGDGVLFTASGGDARERHVYHATPARGWASVALTRTPGVHAVSPAPDGRSWLHTAESSTAAPTLRLETIDGELEHAFEPRPPRGYEARLVPPRLLRAPAADGATMLEAAVYDDGAGSGAGGAARPVVLLVYGGPHAQSVRNAWALTADLRAQYLAQHGFVVVKIDNRGTSNRGIAFEAPLHRRLGSVEVDDQCAVLQHVLAATPGADAARVGVCGWSYGGYMTLRCLQLRPDLFKAGAAGAPVVDWVDYDAPYTERYMGSPVAAPHVGEPNAEGYRQASVTRGDARVQGRLLLIHGMNDENVLLRHSATLMEDLAARRMPYELLLLPGERHGVRSPVQRPYLEQRILEFFQRALT